MPVIATDNQRISNVIKWEAFSDNGFHNDVVVINDAATTLKAGTVLGKVTATGKWRVCKQAAVDGSQNAAGVYRGNLLGDFVDLTVPATTDTKALALVRGPAFVGSAGLVWDASFTTQGQKDTALATLNAALVLVSPQV